MLIASFEQYSRPGSDTKMLEEMSFGAVGMAFRGSTLKVHTIRTPPQLMVTKVFVPALHRARETGSAEPESLDCSLNYSSSELAMPQKISTNPSDSNPSIGEPDAALRCFMFYCIVYIDLVCIALFCSSLFYIALFCIALFCISLFYIALFCILCLV